MRHAIQFSCILVVLRLKARKIKEVVQVTRLVLHEGFRKSRSSFSHARFSVVSLQAADLRANIAHAT